MFLLSFTVSGVDFSRTMLAGYICQVAGLCLFLYKLIKDEEIYNFWFVYIVFVLIFILFASYRHIMIIYT
jgi:hypothetical protein